MPDEQQFSNSPDNRPAPIHDATPANNGGPVGAHRAHGSAGKYILTALVSIFLTFTLTVGGGILVFLNAGNVLSGLASTTGLGIQFANDEKTQTALQKFKAVYDTLDKNYYKDLSDAEMLDAMTRGLVNEMDSPYTMYLDATQTQQIADSMSGNYGGIGAIVAFNASRQIEITEIIPDSPAEEAGLMAGDIFISVDGKSVENMQDTTELAVLVRGEQGTTVVLEMYRPSTNKTLTVNAVRRQITSASVSHHMINDTIGYVRISEFSNGVAEQFILAVEDLKTKGALNIVFDLRNNSGGLATEVIDMLDYLLPAAEIARIEGRNNGKSFSEDWTSKAEQGVPPTMRYAILLNEFSASASELFSGCLHDYKLARLIGEKSYGKGSGTVTYDLADGSSVNVTNFLYYLPGGTCIEGLGLTPDQEVKLPDSAIGKSVPQLTAAEDTQLAAGISYLQSLTGLQ